MSLESGLIFALCSLIIMLVRQHTVHIKIQQRKQQNEKLIQLLQAYPVHQYSMPHMLERSLAMVFASEQYNLIPKGAIFLLADNKLTLSAQRGLTELFDNLQQDFPICSCLSNRWVETDRFQFIPCTNDNLSQPAHDHYIAPLVRNNKLIGVLTLYTAKTNKRIRKEQIKYIKTLAITFSSLTERKQVADELIIANSVLNLSQQAIFITDSNNKIIRCNNACEQITGYSSKELVGRNPSIFKSDYHSSDFYQTLWEEIKENGFWQGEIRNKRKDNSVFSEWLTISSIKDVEEKTTQYLAVFTDLTAIKQAERDIRHLSFFDSLTQLPNRSLFKDRVEQAIIQSERKNRQFALLCLDIDHFKRLCHR